MWNQVVFATLQAKQLTDVGLRIRDPLADCPHTRCRFNGSGLCNGWLPLPQTADECEFPEWLAVNTGRTVSPCRRFVKTDPQAILGFEGGFERSSQR
jgi:hypothetical protein